MKKVQRDPSIKAAAVNSETIILYKNKISSGNNRSRICKEVYASAPIVIYTVKSFWLLQEISERIKLFKAAGLIKFWYDQFINKRTAENDNELSKQPKVLTLSQFYGCFGILVCGLGLSFVVFMIEIISKK